MNLKPSLNLKQTQKLKISPKLQQNIRLLQLSARELEQEIQTLLETNPLLELDNSDDLQEKTFEETVLASVLNENQNQTEYSLEPSQEKTLQEHLLWQMQTSLFSKSERLIANAIIDAISEEGYLGCQLEEIQDTLRIQESCEFPMADIEAVLFKIQEFEPLAVGARNLSECLSIQLNHLPKNTPWLLEAKKLVSSHLALLASKNYSALSSLLKISKAALMNIISLITRLEPRPGRQMISAKSSECIIPDLVLRNKNGSFVVELNMQVIPKLRLNRDYLNIRQNLKGVGTERGTQFFKQHLREAEWFIKGLKNRYATLLKVANCIVKKQTAFLKQGEEYMQGLSLQDVAEITNLHESSISRITTHKYLATERGVFELKRFFSPEILTENGEPRATLAIKAMIKKIIRGESSKKPLTDEQIRVLLKNQNISLSRRTISKYRQLMRIQSSTER